MCAQEPKLMPKSRLQHIIALYKDFCFIAAADEFVVVSLIVVVVVAALLLLLLLRSRLPA
jgi:hypothetical protein